MASKEKGLKMKPKLIIDLGMQYATSKSKKKARYGMFKCKCGNEFKAQTYGVKSGNTSTCGCSIGEKHGLTKTKVYRAWQNMITRCCNKNSNSFVNYGMRGIIVCEEWKNSFTAFNNWANSNGYDDLLTLDRIDNNGNYEPSNCRWTTIFVQAQNKRKLRSNNKSGYRGALRVKNTDKFSASITANKKAIHIGTFNSVEEAALAYDNYVIENNLNHTLNFSKDK